MWWYLIRLLSEYICCFSTKENTTKHLVLSQFVLLNWAKNVGKILNERCITVKLLYIDLCLRPKYYRNIASYRYSAKKKHVLKIHVL